MRSLKISVGLSILAAGVLATVVPTAQSLADQAYRTPPGKASPKPRHNLTALEVFNGTLVKVHAEYVDPKRIDPKRMLYSALDSVQFRIPEVLVEPDEDADKVTVSINNKRQEFSTARVDRPWRLSQELKKIFHFIQSNVSKDEDLARVEYAAINGMLNTLDPHSILLDPEAARDMEVSTSGKFGGLGIEIRMVKKKLTVIRPMKGTPAFRAGVQRGDHIEKIDDELSENLTINEAVDRMRGKPGTKVTLWIRRKGKNDLLKFPIERAIIRLESVKSRMLSKKVGYLTIEHFSRRTTSELRNAMSDLRKQGARAWVLDLRWNPGGLLNQAISVSDLFVDHGTIVTTVEEGGKLKRPRRASSSGTDKTSPIVVLVNSNSASASEIVAGALKNLGRAITIGNTTFGKGSVQVLYPNSDGSKLKLTIGQYLTPGDESIQSVGITPDIQLHRMHVPDQIKSHEDQLRLIPTEHSYREKDLSSHLTSEYTRKKQKPVEQLSFLYRRNKLEKALGEEDLPPVDAQNDFEINLANKILMAADSDANSRSGLLRIARKVLQTVEKEQDGQVTNAFNKIGINWSKGANPGKLNLDTQATLSKTDAQAGDILTIKVTAKNNGSKDVHQILVRLKSSNQSLDEVEIPIGKIPAGQSKTWSTKVQIPDEEKSRVDQIDFELRAAGKKTGVDVQSQRLSVKAQDRPTFAYTYHLIDQGNGDGIPQNGEKHVLRIGIKNTGTGTSKETTAILRNASGDGLLLQKARSELKELKPGEHKTVDFLMTVGKLRSELAVEMSVYDAVLRESVHEKLRFPTGDPVQMREDSRWVKGKSKLTPIYQAASPSAEIVGWLDGAVQTSGATTEWLQVNLGKDSKGFVKRKSVKSSRKSSGGSYVPNWQVTPPKMQLKVGKQWTTKSRYRLTGEVTDDTAVRDVYIFVSNSDAKIFNRKVFYKPNTSGNKKVLPFSADLPLWEGSNRITVVTRENDKVKSAKTIYVTRSVSPIASTK